MITRTQLCSSDAAKDYFQFALPTSLPMGPRLHPREPLGAGVWNGLTIRRARGMEWFFCFVFFFSMQDKLSADRKSKQTTNQKLLIAAGGSMELPITDDARRP